MEPHRLKYWTDGEREAAEVLASRFGFTFRPSVNQFAHADGLLYLGEIPARIVEFKKSDYKITVFERNGVFRINGAKIRRLRLLSFTHGLPAVVAAFLPLSGVVLVWRVTCGAGIDEFDIKFVSENMPKKAGRQRIIKEIAYLPMKHAIKIKV